MTTAGSSHAQATHVVVAVAKYVGLTAAFAEALQKLAGAVAETYGTGRRVIDDVACRRQQAVLWNLVIALRDLEVEKRDLHARLMRALLPMSHWLAWRRVAFQARRVSTGILEVRQQVEENRSAFAESAAVSTAYANLLFSFREKQELLRGLTVEMQRVDWTWARVDPRDARRSVAEIRPLVNELQVQIEVIAAATNVIAEHADGLCEPALG